MALVEEDGTDPDGEAWLDWLAQEFHTAIALGAGHFELVGHQPVDQPVPSEGLERL